MIIVDILKDFNMIGFVVYRNFRGGKCCSSMCLYDNMIGFR